MNRIPDKVATPPALFAALQNVLPDEAIVTAEEERRVYECDGLPIYRQLPMLVVLPENTTQVQEVLRLCNEHKVPVVARGAGTGLSAGATPLADGIVLSLARLNKILAIDPQACTARVQPGVRNLAISEAAAAYDLFYAPDPSSQIACTIGGNIAENSGGVHCLKYGLTVHNVLEIQLLLIDGTRLVLGSSALDQAGYDLTALTIGSEGLLGVVSEVLVKLLPKPAIARVAMAAFDDASKAANAVSAIIAAGLIPAGLEMMDGASIQAVEDYVHVGYPVDAAAMLLCEMDGCEAEVASQMQRIATLLTDCGAVSVRVAANEEERARFWLGRKSAFPAAGRISPDYYCMDGTVPKNKLAQVLEGTARLSREFQLTVTNVFHAGDGNLHPLILFDANKPGELKRAEELGAQILLLCIEVGGTITGEHGVGLEKIKQMCVQFNAEELEQMLRVKTAFDPLELLNPGKAVPHPRHCAEYRLASGIHSGEDAHDRR